jgi:hypothetical protein
MKRAAKSNPVIEVSIFIVFLDFDVRNMQLFIFYLQKNAAFNNKSDGLNVSSNVT